MENKKFSAINLSGEAFYRNIINVVFTPIRKTETLIPKVKKGKIYFWKLWGIIPLIPFRAKEDLYTPSDNIFNRFCGLREEYERKHWVKYTLLKGNDVYNKARINIYCIESRLNETKYFDDNESAMKYLESIKAKCKEVDNTLK